MTNFVDILQEILAEKGKTIRDLEKNNILKKNIIYEFSKYTPSLSNAIAIANYLEVSLDYIINENIENNFKRYKVKQSNFYANLKNILSSMKISMNKLCTDLKLSRNTITRWKNGSVPKLSTLSIVIKYLDCTTYDLLDYEN